MKILFDNTELSETQVDLYHLIMECNNYSAGMNHMIKIAEKKLGIMNSLCCEMRVALNNKMSNYQKLIEDLKDRDGEYIHLIKI